MMLSAPEIASEPVSRCPICRADKAQSMASGFDYELQTCSNRWNFVRCTACGHAWLNPRPAIETLNVIYPQTYYSYNYESVVHPIAARAKQWLDRLKFRSILAAAAQRPRSYLDVGCGTGRFLKLMEREGIERSALYGLELAAEPVRELAQQGYQTYCERVETCSRIAPASLDLITMFHVIEHVDAPSQTVKKLAEWLTPGGVLAIETPNLDSLDARLFRGGYWGGYHIPRHWQMFTPESLKRLLEDAGLELTAIVYQTGHSFWMYSFHHLLKYHLGLPRLAKLFDPFGGVLPLLAMFTAVDKLRASTGFRTSAMLALARKPQTRASASH